MKKLDIVANNYLVAFIDILGQSEELKKFSLLPDTTNAELISEFKTHIKDTAILTHSFHESFKKYFDFFIEKEKQSPYSNLMTNNEIKFQRMTDGIIVYTSLLENQRSIPILGIAGIIHACGFIFLNFLSKGRPLRGGIEIGWGVEINESEIYGAAVYNAYTIESTIAQYPRIVIGQEAIKHFTQVANSTDSSMRAKVSKEIAAKCLTFFVSDDDGNAIIDYLGNSFRRETSEDRILELGKKSYEYILKKSLDLQQQKDSNLAFRYTPF